MKKNLVIVGLACLFSFSAFADTARRAEITCDFRKAVDDHGQVVAWKGQMRKLRYRIDLDSNSVSLNCVGAEICLLDGGPRDQSLTSSVPATARFDAEMPALNIEGGNGDDMDMFTRLTFSAPGQATAVLIFADQGNNGLVTVPSACQVRILK